MTRPPIDPEHFRRCERMYAGANSQQHFTTEIHIDEGRATQTLEVKPEYVHAAKSLHGSVYFKVADDTMFFAAQSLVDDVFVLTTQANIHLTRPVLIGDHVHGSARVINATRNLIICECTETNDEGKVVATATASFMRSQFPLDPILGYR